MVFIFFSWLGCTEFKLYEQDEGNNGENGNDTGASGTGDPVPDQCALPEAEPEELGVGDACPVEP